MAVFYVLDPDPDSARSARAALAGCGQLARFCGGTDVFRVCAAEQWVRGSSRGEIPASSIAGIRSGNFGRNSWSRFWELFAVGHGGWIQIGARPRGHGHGGREDDGYDRGVPGIARDVSDAAGRQSPGEHHRDWACGSTVLRGLEERIGEAGEPAGPRDGATFTMGDCKAVPVAAGDVSGDWGAGNCVWRAGDSSAVADLARDCRVRIVGVERSRFKGKEREKKEGKR